VTIFGGIEAGGTKFVCVVGNGPGDIQEEIRFPTTDPSQTLKQAVDFFKSYEDKNNKLTSLGIASFGPIDLNPNSRTYGYVTSTPKPGWANTDVVGYFKRHFEIPIAWDTDVNGAAIGEGKWGAGKGLENFIYLTIGTGIGGGAIINGAPLHGLVHPEMGHMQMPHDWQKDPYKGKCPYHGDCFEGMAAGPALNERWGQPAETLGADHPAWDLEAHYIALALQTFICSFSPQRIILGGGVMQQEQIFRLIREKVKFYLNGYVQAPEILEKVDEYIVPPGLGNQAGMLGAIAMAQQIAH
jgi:fructokinase